MLPLLYCLPKTHKENLEMRPILSAIGTYNYNLAQWLEEILKPLAQNQFTISDLSKFAKEEINGREIDKGSILVSYDVTALFTNVPVGETIEFLIDKAFKENWLNETYDLKLNRKNLRTLLQLATKDQLFLFEGQLYEQTDGVAMGSPLGPLMANAFMCSIEEKLANGSQIPPFYRRYVDDTVTIMPNAHAASAFLSTLNSTHGSLHFTMELPIDDALPFCGMSIRSENGRLHHQTYRKPTDTGLLLHFKSFVDSKYKRCLITTMLHRAFMPNIGD